MTADDDPTNEAPPVAVPDISPVVEGGNDLSDGANPLAIPPQSPLFRAYNMGRYRRQEVIKAIQDTTGRKLICYVADGSASIERDDVMPLMDLLHRVPVGSNLDFLLQTGGGDIDAAEKIVGILRQRVGGTGELRVIVPDFAKSAGTLIAIGADVIVMSDSSELGPIDPQIVTRDAKGQTTQRPAHSYVDGYDALVTAINDPQSYEGGKRTDAERQVLATYDPALVDLCRQSIRRSRALAEKLLSQGMLRDSPSWTEVAARLTDNRHWLSQHAAVINSDDAASLGFRVEYMLPDGEQWQAFWRLYCEQRLSLRADGPKLFESDYASIPFS